MMGYEFNKMLLLRNIEHLMKEKGLGIGDFEEKTGVSKGYIARTKKDEKSKPGIDFIMKASDVLEVNIYSLLTVDFTSLTPNEQYILRFLNKMNKDTLDGKLYWDRESEELNHLEAYINGDSDHPLFAQATFYEETPTEYPEEVTRVVFNSKNYGYNTFINDDCFNIRLKNGTYVYLMNISKSVHRSGDIEAYAKEVWLYNGREGRQFLCDNWGERTIAAMVDTLYANVKEDANNPKLDKTFRDAIDAFMNDDVTDDVTEDLPFL